MKSLGLWILALMLVWPIDCAAAWITDRPVHLTVSDLLLVVLPIICLFVRSTSSTDRSNPSNELIRWRNGTLLLALACVVYMVGLGVIGLCLTGDSIRLISALKLAKPIGFIFLGLFLGSSIDSIEFFRFVGRAFGVVAALTFFSTVTDPSLALREWGKQIFTLNLTGYPNAAMSFFAILVPLLLASTDSSSHCSVRMIGWWLAAGSAILIVGSYSRSSALVLFFATAIYLALTGRWTVVVGCTVAFAVLSVIGLDLVPSKADTRAVAMSVDQQPSHAVRTKERIEPSNGRIEIWKFTLELAKERPVWGYLFEPFSHYAGDIDNPHMQYLEILYKCGGVGLILYLGLLASCLLMTGRLLMLTERATQPWYQLCAIAGMLLGVFLGNLTQSNLSFSLTGNLVFLVCGCLSSDRAIVSITQSTEMNQGLLFVDDCHVTNLAEESGG